QAVSSCRKGLAVQPAMAEAWTNLGNSCLKQNRMDEAVAALDRALSLNPYDTGAHDNLCLALLYRDDGSPEQIFAAHRRYAAHIEDRFSAQRPLHANTADPGRRIRVGYLSPDFRQHSVAYFMEPLLAHHDRQGVEVYAYHDSLRHDAV